MDESNEESNLAQGYSAGDSAFRQRGQANPFSFDQRGVVHIRNDSVSRELVPELDATFDRLEREGRLERLFDVGLIRTWREPDTHGVVQHERIPFVTYPQEWSASMLKSAALCILDIALLLEEADLSLQDPHPWNVTFSRGKPTYYDFSSVFEGRQLHRRFVSDFFKGCYLPLWLRSQKLFAERFQQVSRAVMGSEHEWRLWRQPRIEWRRLFDRNLFGRFCRRFWNAVDKHDPRQPARLLRALRDLTAAIEFPTLPSMWGQYNDPGGDFNDLGSFSPKARAVTQFIQGLPRGRVLDLACNRGWFSAYASRLGDQVLGLDVDENAIDAALPRARENGFDVAHMNVVWPTPPQGAFLMYPSAYQRFEADTVLMIALQHHLNLRQSIGFGALGAMATRFGAKNLIIEWTPKQDVVVQHWLQTGTLRQIPEWYTEEQFAAALRRHFPVINRIASGAGHDDFPGPTERFMFLCQR